MRIFSVILDAAQSGSSRRESRAGRAGFTLIELLVVIAIIAILAALLLPSLARSKDQAKLTQCLSNMKQLQVCYHMYVMDANDFLPPNESEAAFDTTTNSWVTGDAQTDTTTANIQLGLLWPYNKSALIYVCPGDNLIIHSTSLPATNAPQTRSCSVNYAMNGSGGSGLNADNPGLNGLAPIVKYSGIIKPGTPQMAVFVDESEYECGDGCFGLYTWAYTIANPPSAWWNPPASRHGKTCTFSFADGHEEFLKWHGTAVPAFTSTDGPWPADSSDDLFRVERWTLP
jgi:prepilin-type N-terminal cleavage/methylation domain-containing protein/prepilin-type processing-associated H-X9-DG protein